MFPILIFRSEPLEAILRGVLLVQRKKTLNAHISKSCLAPRSEIARTLQTYSAIGLDGEPETIKEFAAKLH